MYHLNEISRNVYLEIRDKQLKEESKDNININVSSKMKFKSRKYKKNQKNREQDYDNFCSKILSEELKKYDFSCLNKKFYSIKNQFKFQQLKNMKNLKQLGSKQKLLIFNRNDLVDIPEDEKKVYVQNLCKDQKIGVKQLLDIE